MSTSQNRVKTIRIKEPLLSNFQLEIGLKAKQCSDLDASLVLESFTLHTCVHAFKTPLSCTKRRTGCNCSSG